MTFPAKNHKTEGYAAAQRDGGLKWTWMYIEVAATRLHHDSKMDSGTNLQRKASGQPFGNA
jgi:hypothetical protein